MTAIKDLIAEGATLLELGGTQERGAEWHMKHGERAGERHVAYMEKGKANRALLATLLASKHIRKIMKSGRA